MDFFAVIFFSQMIAKKMIRQKKGNIINIASVRGLKPEPGNLAYGTAKCALIYATKVLAEELKPYGIRVNAIAPGAIQTEMISYKSSATIDMIKEKSALGRLGTKQEVVKAVRYLCDENSSGTTGEILTVSGGYFD